MRRTALVLIVFVAALGVLAIAGCGGEEEATPTPETTTGTLPTETTATETTETETTETTGTETTETTTTATEPTGEGDPVAGKQVFLGPGGCGSCHTLGDAGTSGTVGPNLDDAKPSYERAVQQVTNGGGAMPPFKDTLTEQQIRDVAAYVSQTVGG
jgi:mono/diheme cytochrome c family protein